MGMTYAPFVARVGGLEEGFHTVVVTQNSAGYIYLMSFSGNLGLATRSGPEVWIGNCLRMSAAGYSVGNGSDAAVAKYNTVIRTVARELANDGLNIGLADAAALYDPSTQEQSDHIHPSVGGHQTIAEAFLTAMQPAVHAGDRLKP
jgi:hypothetical protein